MAKKKETYEEYVGGMAEETYVKMNEDEKKVFDIIVATWDDTDYPEDFYTSKTPEEVNEFYGGKGKMKVTKAVYDCLCFTFEDELIWNVILDEYDDLPETDEEE